MEFYDEYVIPDEPSPSPDRPSIESAIEPQTLQVPTSETAPGASGRSESVGHQEAAPQPPVESPESSGSSDPPFGAALGGDEDDAGFFSDPLLRGEQGLHTLELVQEQSRETEEQFAHGKEDKLSVADSCTQLVTGTQEAVWETEHGPAVNGAPSSPFDAGVIMALAGALILKKCGQTQEANDDSEERT